MYCEIPPYRNFSTKDLKATCKKGRGWASRCKKAIQFAVQMGLVWKISREVMNPDSPFFSDAITSLIQEIAGDEVYLD
jgi:hypothetical protein